MFADLSGEEIVSRTIDLGFTQIELNFTLRSKQASAIVESALRQGLYISSLHNFVPEPPESERGFMLSDIDQNLRHRAVQLTKDTIMLAADVGARAVILHMGQPRNWDYGTPQKELRQKILDKADTDEIAKLTERFSEKRKGLPEVYLESMLRSLDEILQLAGNLNIGLGVENRYFYGQFPDFEELGIIFQEFSGSTIGYWHDCGHARQITCCGLGTETEGLEIFKGCLVGIHLHDTKLWTDHQLPGPDGDIDFSYLIPFIKPETILNLEPARNADAGHIPIALEYLGSFGIK